MASREQARLFGVLGDPVEHSLSPAMQNAAFAAARLPHLYLRYRVSVADLATAFGEARMLRMGGLNLTVPLKEAALPLLDDLTPEASRVGAVNTILFRAGGRRLIGHNTDALGFLRALRGRVSLRGATALVIGAGGSARAVGAALARAGTRHIIVANRSAARAAQLADRLGKLAPARVTCLGLPALARGDVLAEAALVVNTTPLGLMDGTLRVHYAAAPRTCLFIDLVYRDRPTAFLVAAARAGHPTLDGAPMLLHQGALAFEAWTGRPAPRAAMAGALAAAGLMLTPPRASARGRIRGRRLP